MKCSRILLGTVLGTVILVFSGSAYAEDQSYIAKLANLDIEGLMNQEVTSVLRKEQTINHAPSAIYVITQEDIQRSGLRSIPEILRLAPGITVTHTNSSSWNVTARGFDTNGSAKLLVLIDGRSVYSPLFSGVFWDVQDVNTEDIERIEVIRGPGAVSWGENAVNGVINIITKSAKDTVGGFVEVGGKDIEHSFENLTYGGKIGDETYYRIFGKYFSRGGMTSSLTKQSAHDGWDLGSGGFRVDSNVNSKEKFTFQGDMYGGTTHQETDLFDSLSPPYTEHIRNINDLHGGNILARWTNEISATSQTTLQTYFDRTSRHNSTFGEDRNTFDLDFQHHLKAGKSHDIVYGGDYRITSDHTEGSTGIQIDPASRTDNFGNVFLQDQIKLIPETFDVIPGIKLGYNDYSQFDYQPALKFLWTPSKNNTFWSSVSRAVRAPARIDEDIKILTPPVKGGDGSLTSFGLFGDRSFSSEDLIAYELGYRTLVTKDLTLDVSTYYHHYSNLLGLKDQSPFIEPGSNPPFAVIPFTTANDLNGNAYGLETSASWKTTSWLDLSGTYSLIDLSINSEQGLASSFTKGVSRETPQNTANLRAHVILPQNVTLDILGYYVDSIPAFQVRSYIRTDAQITYSLSKDLRVSLVGTNLTGSDHREWNTESRGEESSRGYYAKLSYQFK